MERAMSVEERIRRAEEIYEKRKNGSNIDLIEKQEKVKEEKKDIKLLKKMVRQLIICALIYLIIYTIQNNKYIFSEDFINKTEEIISYDIDLKKLLNDSKNYIMTNFKTKEETQEKQETEEKQEESDNGIGRFARRGTETGKIGRASCRERV